MDESDKNCIELQLVSNSKLDLSPSGLPHITEADASNSEEEKLSFTDQKENATSEARGRYREARYKQLRIETNLPDHSAESHDIGKTLYKEEAAKELGAYLDERKENVIHFKAMVKHFGVTVSMIDHPAAANILANRRTNVRTPDAHVTSIGATHEDKVMFIRFIVDEFKKRTGVLERKLTEVSEKY